MRNYGWRTWGDFARELFLGAFIGCFVLLIEEGAQDAVPNLRALTRNAIIGALCVIGARGLETALSWAIEQSRVATLFRTVTYVAGGWLGYFAAVSISGVLFEYEARDFDLRGFHFLYALAVTAAISLLVGLILHHNRKRNDRLRHSIERLKEHEFAEKELEIARSMQERLLPPADIERDGYRITARTQAAHMVGGDFYDVIRLNDGAVAVLAADVSGKGIAASLLMASCKAAVPFLASNGGAAEVMTALNRRLFDQLERREFVAMVFCRFDPETGESEIVNAGMPDPLLISGDRLTAVDFRGDRLPLGAMRNTQYDTTRLTLRPGERLLLFSDGLPEAVAGDKPFGYDRVETLVRASSSVDDMLARLRAEDVRVEDDLTLVMLERPPGSS